jgi:hypothetical protein
VDQREESLRSRVLLPYLTSLGLSLDEIVVEKAFRLRLGRRVHELSSNRIRGRADILVRDGEGNNLFVVELKRDGLELTDEDRV